MSVPNLTRTDAAARAELLDVQSYDLQLDVTDGAGHPGEHTFRSVTTVEFASRTAGAETRLHRRLIGPRLELTRAAVSWVVGPSLSHGSH